MTAVDALLYPSFVLGAAGAIAAILTAVPTLCVSLWEAVRAGNYRQALERHEKLLPIWNALCADNLPAPSVTVWSCKAVRAGSLAHLCRRPLRCNRRRSARYWPKQA
jgi:dihydrodipicolinate synthase/N-acetylneuraminate lyase